MMIRSLVRFARRQLHTIVCREIIKPSSPTPSHLKTYNLSVIDQIIPHAYMPMIAFYPNTSIYRSSHDKTHDLKNSLSQTLTKYYPFAGRLPKVAPVFVDCNDNGVEFLEASIDSTLSDFLKNSQHEDLDQFFPHGLVYCNSNSRDDVLENEEVIIPLAVQVNHFECGGVAVAVSMSHKIADGSSLVQFINDWATMTRFFSDKHEHEVLVDPKFISVESIKLNYIGDSLDYESKDCVTRSFVFPNSKINELKLKVKAITSQCVEPITNATRVEVLSWLLYKCVVGATTKNNSGSFKPTGVYHALNLRNMMIESMPEKSIGNFAVAIEMETNNESEISAESFINDLKMKKLELLGIRNIETVFDLFTQADLEEIKMNDDHMYMCSSMCGFPGYEIDFGWGKPVKVTIAGNLRKNSFILMDTPNRDGIEALVCLGKQDMATIQSDNELLAFC
ncbi:unnamed protein product [Lactuca saligna]|uniref:Transferase, Chloramphenicol acetyltransferase-like domain protein n=1 Tax=Lactuca saligna TaxID=75948 RepID=A0AA36EPW4_LACSI|nr:unnamed protein product [Lactuca saligna]